MTRDPPPIRGEIYLVGPAVPGAEPLPWLVIQHDALSVHAPSVVVAGLSPLAQRAGFPLTLRLEPADTGLAETVWAKLTQIHTASRHRLGQPLGRVAPARMADLDRALAKVLALDPPRYD